MNSLHHYSVLSIPYELPALSHPLGHPYGLMFGECKAGESIQFHRDVPFHLLFLLKGAACVRVDGKEIDIFPNEFMMVDSAVPVQGECVCTHRSHYVIIRLEKPWDTGTDIYTTCTPAQPHTIPPGLSALLRYMMPTMPLNEKINHHLIPRIVSSMMRIYRYAMVIE